MMRSGDPLEHAFELLKADSTELAPNPNLEQKLMSELQRQHRPRRFKKFAMVAAALMALVLTGGGIAYAAGYNPIKLFLVIEDGKAVVFDENGNPANLQVGVTQHPDGTTATVTMPQPGSYSITIAPPGEQTKARK